MFIDTDSTELQSCPAAVDMETGDVYINRDVWDRYTEAEQRFIIEHELGHYYQQTDSETEADLYALNANFGKVYKSLKSSFTAVEKAGVDDEYRWTNLYENALQIDADNGNPDAQEELERIKSINQNQLNQTVMTKRNHSSQITYIQPMVAAGRVNSFDGQEPGLEVESGLKNACRPCGITIGNCYVRLTDILLGIIAIILISKLG